MAEGTDCEGIPSTTNGNAKPIKLFKLVVFGGTGPCGTEVVKQALELGHEVTVVARTPEKFQIKHENLEMVKGDAYSIETFESVLAEKDAVLSCLGSPAVGPFATTTLYSDTVKVIIEGMKKKGVSRFIAVTSWCTRTEPNNPWFIEWILKPLFIGGCLKDMAVMEEILRSTNPDEINYTIVRPPRLTRAAANGNYKIEEGICNTGTTIQIPRADVAHFMLSALQTKEYDRKEMAVASL